MRTLIVALAFLGSALLADTANLLAPTNKAESWRFEQHEGGKGSLKAEGDEMIFTVTEVDGTDWHVQVVQPNLDLAEGKDYVLKFQAKASEPRNITVSANIDEDDWHTIGLAEQVSLDTAYKPVELKFRAENVVAKKNRISLLLGDAKGTVTVKDMTLTAG